MPDEYIKRQALLDLLADEDRCGYLDEQDIKSVPAEDVVSVEPARWLTSRHVVSRILGIGQPSFTYLSYCSRCGWYMNSKYRKPNFCPECGAKMKR